MAKVAVVFPPLRVSRDFIDYPYFADLGAVQNAAVLREAGHDVAVIDAFALPGSTLVPVDAGYVRLGVAPDDVPLPEVDLTLVAYTPFHRPPHRDDTLAGLLTRVRGPVALADFYQSGQHYVDAPHAEILAAYPEAAGYLRYEAEDHLLAFVDRLLAGERGVYVRGGEVRGVGELPLPAWDLVDTEAYFAFHERVVAGLGRGGWAFPITGRSMPLVTSRGCPFRCVHCSSNPGREPGAPKVQRRYGEAQLDALFGLLRARGAERVHLLDELANVSERHFDVLLRLVARHGLSFEIPNGLRADYVRDHHLAQMRGKLTTLSVSAESGSKRVVSEVVDKQLDLADIERVATGAKRDGVPLLVHFMIGLPGETKEEINDTLRYAAHLADDLDVHAAVQHATPLPGTRLAAMAGEPGRRALPVVSDWGPLFQGAPSIASEHAGLDELSAFRGAFDRRGALAKTVVVSPTYRCNNRCDGCTTGTGEPVDEDPRTLVAALRAARERGVERLELGGGEPTSFSKLSTLVSQARAMGFRDVVLVTNGRMLSHRPFAERLVAAGLTEAWVSLHGAAPGTHDALVHVEGAHAEASSGLDHLTSFPGVRVGVATTLYPATVPELPELARFSMDRGLSHLVSVLQPRPATLPRESLDALSAFASGHPRALFVGVSPCELPASLAARVVDPDGLGKRTTAFRRGVREPSTPRVRRDACGPCVHAVGCAGFFGG